MIPTARSSRRLWCGFALTATCVLAVLVGRGTQKYRVPQVPDYRRSGTPDAKVVLVEYSDFQCPACAAAVETVKLLKGLYGERLLLLYKHRPWVRVHPWAKSAALSAECAGRQGKFWEFHDLLYLKQAEWSRAEKPNAVLADYARSLKLYPAAYLRCVEDPAIMALVEADMQEADERWINSTPTFFVNGLRVVGSRRLRAEGLREIERVLGR